MHRQLKFEEKEYTEEQYFGELKNDHNIVLSTKELEELALLDHTLCPQTAGEIFKSIRAVEELAHMKQVEKEKQKQMRRELVLSGPKLAEKKEHERNKTLPLGDRKGKDHFKRIADDFDRIKQDP